MVFDLNRLLRVLLFASNGPLSVKDIQSAVIRFHEQADRLPLGDEQEPDALTDAAGAADPGEAPGAMSLAAPPERMDGNVPALVTAAEITEAMKAISLEMQAGNGDLLLCEGPTGWRLVTHPRFAPWVRLLRNEPPPARLSPSSLETLAVVAYRQPVTRADIEQIRGVAADAGLAKLLERDLIYVVGRADLPGRPIQYGTTEVFLDFVGIKSLDELPSSDVLSPRQIDSWLQSSNQPRAATDSDMGLDETEETQLSLEAAAKPGPP